MGKERHGRTRLALFISDNLAIQLKEYAYQNRETITSYVQNAILIKIKKEREKVFINESNKKLSGL